MSQYQSTSTLQKSVPTYSIPRAERLVSAKLNCDNIYSKPEQKSTRSTTMGYGIKKDLLPLAGRCTPSPNAYNIRSFNEENNLHRKGVILAQRLKSNSVSLINTNKLNNARYLMDLMYQAWEHISYQKQIKIFYP